MKIILTFLLGILVGAGGYHLLAERGTPDLDDPVEAAPHASNFDRAKAEMREVRDRIGDKLEEWNLSGDDIKRELAASGRVIRNKARAAGARVDDARVVSVIKAKYVLDEQLKALEINVDCRDGRVRLRGEVPSNDAIGRAVALALETDGVVEVNAELTAPGA